MMLVIVIVDYNPDSDGDPIIGTAPPAGSRFSDKHLGQCTAVWRVRHDSHDQTWLQNMTIQKCLQIQ